MVEKILALFTIAVLGVVVVAPWLWNFVHPVAGVTVGIGVIYGVYRLAKRWLN